MEDTTTSLLQVPASQPPPFHPLLPTSRLLFPDLPILELEGLKILDPEDLPPYPGEAPNWSSYGTYLQDLSAYNSTGINVPQTSETSPNSKQTLRSSPPASTSQRILRSYTSASTSQRILRSSTASSTLNLSKAAKCTFKSVPSPAASTPTTVTTSSIKKSKRSSNNAKRRAYDKARYQQNISSEENREKMRAKWRYYYYQRKANGKLVQRKRKRLESEAQKASRRIRWKVDTIQSKSKGQGQVLSTEKEPVRCKKEKDADEPQLLEEQEPMKRGRGGSTSKR
ncbi:unnamed protein product [Orchesella dallaii]|uniref:BZIP domain-containing protein n=1 Tax=Orchesella dallaii TaxID=48710 RepID=A0ABP1R548_9HEXA